MACALSDRRITRAIIPLAGRGTRLCPATRVVPKALFPLVDVDGVCRPVVHIICREARAAGIERIALVVSAPLESALAAYFGAPGEPGLPGEHAEDLADLARRITFIRQERPEGLGHAVWCARDFAGEGAVLVMLGDHVYRPEAGAAPVGLQVARAFEMTDGVSVTGVAVSPIGEVHLCGTLAGRPVGQAPPELAGRLYRVERVLERPTPEQARRHLVSPGLPDNRFLTHFGLYAFGPEIFDALEELVTVQHRQRGEIQLTEAQARLIRARQNYYALRVQGRPYDVGTPRGLVRTQTGMGDPTGTVTT